MAVLLETIRSALQNYVTAPFGHSPVARRPNVRTTKRPKVRRSPEIKTVTVAGITGAIGPPIIDALVDAGFQVQALTRKHTTLPAFPVRICAVDYEDASQLRSLLQNQDAVVSCLGDTPPAVAAQRVLIEASVDVGVKRFLPSEFGSDTTNSRVRHFPFFKAKVEHQELLARAAAVHSAFTYTLLITGPFLDWGLSIVPFIINPGSGSAQVFDGGDVPFSVTRTVSVGKAVVSVLCRPEETKNRALFIHETVVTQNQLIACAERHRHPRAAPFAGTPVDCEHYETSAWQAFFDPASHPLNWILPFINLSIWSKDELCHFLHTDNALLGVEELHGQRRETMIEQQIIAAIGALAVKPDAASASEPKPSLAALAVRAHDEGKMKLVSW